MPSFPTRSVSRVRGSLVAIAAVTVAMAGGVALIPASPAAASVSVAASGSVRLSDQVLPGLSHLTVLHAAAPTQQMTISLALRLPHPAAESAELAALQSPSSPEFRRYLTPSEVAARFGVSQQTADAARNWLVGGGLHVLSESSDRDLFVAQGAVSQVERLFQVTENVYKSAQGPTFIANAQGPTVPANLDVMGLAGLNTWMHASTLAHASDEAAGLPVGTGQTIDAKDIWSIYDMPSADMGQGQKIAILGEGVLGSDSTKGSVIADLRQFEQEHGFPTVPVAVTCVINNDCGTDTSGSVEWDLDEDATTGVAPDIEQLHFYFAQDLSDVGQEAMIDSWLDDPNGPLQANASFAECEAGPYNSIVYGLPGNVDSGSGVPTPVSGFGPTGLQIGDDLEGYVEQSLEAGALEGRSLFAAAGDTGSGCTAVIAAGFGTNGLAPSPYPGNPYPAGASYAVAVGGTTLSDTGTTPESRSTEIAWPFTGGGSSLYLKAPSYQQGVTNLTGQCIVSPDGTTSEVGESCRGVPDVAAMASDNSNDLDGGYEYVSGGQDGVEGGTSLASPLNVGMWTRIQDAYAHSSGSTTGLGFANFTYYALGKNPTTDARDFFDITEGTNGQSYCGTGPCIAQTGWDYTSGWGVPDVAHIIADLPTGQSGGNLPETPLVPLLALAGFAMLGAGRAVRRRRASA